VYAYVTDTIWSGLKDYRIGLRIDSYGLSLGWGWGGMVRDVADGIKSNWYRSIYYRSLIRNMIV
jgi:hypothetical protein